MSWAQNRQQHRSCAFSFRKDGVTVGLRQGQAMRDEIANLVYPVLTQGIRLKERLAANDSDVPDFRMAQKELMGLLQSAGQAQRFADFGGDRPATDSMRGRPSDQFLGIRYA